MLGGGVAEDVAVAAEISPDAALINMPIMTTASSPTPATLKIVLTLAFISIFPLLGRYAFPCYSDV
jgi:hypothetical protein